VIARLAVRDLRDSWLLWSAAAFVAAAGAFVALIPATVIESALPVRGVTSLALLAIGGTVIVFTVVSVVVVTASVARATIDARRSTFGLWQVSGVLPRQVALVVFAQVALVAVLGAVPGAALGLWFGPGFARETLAAALGDFGAHVGMAGALVAVAVVVAVVCLAAIPAARRAGQTPPVRLLTDIDESNGDRKLGRARALAGKVVGAAVLVLIVYQLIVSLPGSVDEGGSQSLLIGPVIITLLCLSGRRAMATLARAWTAIVPKSWSISFFLARADVSRSRDGASAVIPFVVSIGLPVTFLAGTSVAASAAGSPVGNSSGGTALILFGPVLLAAIGGGAALLLRSVQRERESSVLHSLGAGVSVLGVQRLWEAAIVVVSAALVAIFALVLTVVTEVTALSAAYSSTAVYLDGRPLIITVGLCLTVALSVAASGVPAIARRSRK